MVAFLQLRCEGREHDTAAGTIAEPNVARLVRQADRVSVKRGGQAAVRECCLWLSRRQGEDWRECGTFIAACPHFTIGAADFVRVRDVACQAEQTYLSHTTYAPCATQR